MKTELRIAVSKRRIIVKPLIKLAGDPIFDFEVLEVDPQQDRHERFLQHFEFDACELSFSSYVVAMDQGVPAVRELHNGKAANRPGQVDVSNLQWLAQSGFLR